MNARTQRRQLMEPRPPWHCVFREDRLPAKQPCGDDDDTEVLVLDFFWPIPPHSKKTTLLSPENFVVIEILETLSLKRRTVEQKENTLWSWEEGGNRVSGHPPKQERRR